MLHIKQKHTKTRKCGIFDDFRMDVGSTICDFLQNCDEYKESTIDILSISVWKKCELKRNFIKYEINAFSGTIIIEYLWCFRIVFVIQVCNCTFHRSWI